MSFPFYMSTRFRRVTRYILSGILCSYIFTTVRNVFHRLGDFSEIPTNRTKWTPPCWLLLENTPVGGGCVLSGVVVSGFSIE